MSKPLLPEILPAHLTIGETDAGKYLRLSLAAAMREGQLYLAEQSQPVNTHAAQVSEWHTYRMHAATFHLMPRTDIANQSLHYFPRNLSWPQNPQQSTPGNH